MKTLIYKDASKIPDTYLKNLVKPQVQCWGSAPYYEYKICVDSKCRRLIGIEEIHKVEGSADIWNEEASDFCCPNCGDKTNFIYKKAEYLEAIKEFVIQNVWSILLIGEDEKICGFALAKLSSIGSLVDYEYATRPYSYDGDKLQESLSQSIFGKKNAADENLVLLHHIYLSPEIRLKLSSYSLFCQLLLNAPEDYSSLPVTLETRYDSKMYSMSRSLGFTDIINDQYGYVAQSHQNYGTLTEQLTGLEDGYRELLPSMKIYKQEACELIENTPSFYAPYYYKK